MDAERVDAKAVRANDDKSDKAGRKGKGIDILPTCGPLQLYSSGCAHRQLY